MWLTLLAPEIAEATMEARQPPDMTMPVLMKPYAVEWVTGSPRDRSNPASLHADNCSRSRINSNSHLVIFA